MACADNIFNISVFKKKCEEADAFFRLEYQYKHKAFEPPAFTQEHYDDEEEEESCSSSEDEDDENLPLIPEIELVTLNDDDDDEEESDDGERPDVPFTENQDQDGHVVSYECSTCNKTYLNRRFMEKHVRRNRCMQKRKNQT